MRFDMFTQLTATEIEIQKQEAVERIQERYRLPFDVAERIVASAKDIDQACSIAELMR